MLRIVSMGLKMYFVEHQGADLLNEAIALRVMNESGVDADKLSRLLEASKLRQVIMAKAENGEPFASLAYAKISKYTLKLIASNPDHRLRPYEYKEGKVLFILDGFFRKGCFKKSIALLESHLKKYRLIAYVNRGRLRVLYNNSGSMVRVKFPASWIGGSNLFAIAETNHG